MTQKQSYFIEGLQGAGKSTLVNRLAENYPEKKVCREGDYTPEGEILAFYRKVHEILQNNPYKILYLDVEDIEGSLEVIKKKELIKMVWSPEGENL